jgi:hypothetical protein
LTRRPNPQAIASLRAVGPHCERGGMVRGSPVKLDNNEYIIIIAAAALTFVIGVGLHLLR